MSNIRKFLYSKIGHFSYLRRAYDKKQKNFFSVHTGGVYDRNEHIR